MNTIPNSDLYASVENRDEKIKSYTVPWDDSYAHRHCSNSPMCGHMLLKKDGVWSNDKTKKAYCSQGCSNVAASKVKK